MATEKKKGKQATTGPTGKTVADHVKDVLAEKNTIRWTADEKSALCEVGEELGELLLQRIEGEDVDAGVVKCHAAARNIAAYAGAAVTGVSVLNEACGRYTSSVLRGFAPQ